MTPQASAQCRIYATMFSPTPKEAIVFSAEKVDLGMKPTATVSSYAFLSHIWRTGNAS